MYKTYNKYNMQFVISSQYFTLIEDIKFIDARNSLVSIKQSSPLFYSPVNQPITTFSLAALLFLIGIPRDTSTCLFFVVPA